MRNVNAKCFRAEGAMAPGGSPVSQKFFITGLPRSRTAWLANLLSYGDKSFCFHEAVRRATDLEAQFKLYDSVTHDLVGDSSCGLLLNWQEVSARYPDARWVIIRRDPQQVLESSRRAFPWLKVTADAIRDLAGRLREARNALPNLLSVEFDELDEKVPEILDHIGLQINPLRLGQCLENKVEIAAHKAVASPACPDSPLRFKMVELMRDYKPGPGSAEVLSEQYRALLREMCGKREDAYWFLNELLNVWLVWDHFRDHDVQNPADVEAAFTSMLLHWPNNTFVCEWGRFLTPTISAAITANKADGQGIKGWDVYTEIPMAVATVLGGHALAEKYSKPIRDLVAQIKAADDREDVV
jgi:hypothetical protein